MSPDNSSVPVASCTMRTVAERLGVSVMTVSRALRNAPNVAPETRGRVLEEAQRLNFQPDPALGVLNAYRHQKRSRQSHEQIAFVTDFPQPNAWKRVTTFVRYYEGARRKAEQLGYRLEPFWLGDPELTARRSSQILRDRGVRGILVGPLSKGNSEIALEWNWFSAVALGRSLATPKLTTVSTNHFQALTTAWENLRARGYKRIGFSITQYEDERTQGGLRAAYLLSQTRHDGPILPLHLCAQFSAAEMAKWAQAHRPQVLMSSEQNHHDQLPAKLRARIGFVHLNIDPAAKGVGIDQGHDLVGEQAAALLHLKLLQRQTGVLMRRELFMVDGTWRDGSIVAPE